MKINSNLITVIAIVSGLMIGYQAESNIRKTIFTPPSINIASEVVEDYNDAIKAVNKAKTPQAVAAASTQLTQAKAARSESLKDQAASKTTQILNDRVNMPQNNLSPSGYTTPVNQPMFCLEGATSYPVDSWVVAKGDNCKRCSRTRGGGGSVTAGWGPEVSCKYKFIQPKLLGSGKAFCTLYSNNDSTSFSNQKSASYPIEIHYPISDNRIRVKLGKSMEYLKCIASTKTGSSNSSNRTTQEVRAEWSSK